MRSASRLPSLTSFTEAVPDSMERVLVRCWIDVADDSQVGVEQSSLGWVDPEDLVLALTDPGHGLDMETMVGGAEPLWLAEPKEEDRRGKRWRLGGVRVPWFTNGLQWLAQVRLAQMQEFAYGMTYPLAHLQFHRAAMDRWLAQAWAGVSWTYVEPRIEMQQALGQVLASVDGLHRAGVVDEPEAAARWEAARFPWMSQTPFAVVLS